MGETDRALAGERWIPLTIDSDREAMTITWGKKGGIRQELMETVPRETEIVLEEKTS